VVDLLAIGQGLNAIRAIGEITKVMLGARDSAKFLENSIELQSKVADALVALNSALTEQTALLKTINDLEATIARMKKWEREKRRYELIEIAPRVFAYVIKETARRGAPRHKICAACYEHGQKSILQGEDSYTFGWSYLCPICKTVIKAGHDR
jgi:hypothetical protein